VTDDGFDDYVDEESTDDFVAGDVDAGGDLAAEGAGIATDHGMTSGIDGEIAAPGELGAWAWPAATGVASVDAAIDELARLDELPTSEHVAVYEGLHAQLQDALADLDGS
jgi:hypothetical protein